MMAALIRRRVTVGLASFSGRVWLRLLTASGDLRAEQSLDQEEFNQLVADCLALQDQLRGPLIVEERGRGH